MLSVNTTCLYYQNEKRNVEPNALSFIYFPLFCLPRLCLHFFNSSEFKCDLSLVSLHWISTFYALAQCCYAWYAVNERESVCL